jgi:hypothetical protein
MTNKFNAKVNVFCIEVLSHWRAGGANADLRPQQAPGDTAVVALPV